MTTERLFAEKIIVNIKFEFIINLDSDYIFALAIDCGDSTYLKRTFFISASVILFLSLLKKLSVNCFNEILDLY